MKSLFRRVARHWLPFCVLMAALLVTSTAFAYGRVQWSSLRVKENVVGTQSNWKLELKIFLPKPPDFAHVPVKFEFKQTVYYERFQDDSSPEPQMRRVPTPNSQAIIESVDLGFLDPGTGKIQSRTRFAFKITRAHGFEAGEYRVTIRNTRTGAILGTPVKLVLDGENEVIDRRAMVFSGDKKKDKEEKKTDASEESAEVDQDDASYASGESMDYEEVDEEGERLPPPEPLDTKRGCGCRTVGGAPSSNAVWALPLFLGLAVWMRRQRRRAA